MYITRNENNHCFSSGSDRIYMWPCIHRIIHTKDLSAFFLSKQLWQMYFIYDTVLLNKYFLYVANNITYFRQKSQWNVNKKYKKKKPQNPDLSVVTLLEITIRHTLKHVCPLQQRHLLRHQGSSSYHEQMLMYVKLDANIIINVLFSLSSKLNLNIITKNQSYKPNLEVH